MMIKRNNRCSSTSTNRTVRNRKQLSKKRSVIRWHLSYLGLLGLALLTLVKFNQSLSDMSLQNGLSVDSQRIADVHFAVVCCIACVVMLSGLLVWRLYNVGITPDFSKNA